MDKLTAIKIKYDDGTYSDQIPVSATAANVQWDSTHSLVDVLGQIALDDQGNLYKIQDQITQLFNSKVASDELATYVNGTMKTEVTQWLSTYVSPATGTIAYDKSLSVTGAAADAKSAGQIVKISTTKPTQEWNRVWVGAAEQEIAVPTMEEFDDLKSNLNDIIDSSIESVAIYAKEAGTENLPAGVSTTTGYLRSMALSNPGNLAGTTSSSNHTFWFQATETIQVYVDSPHAAQQCGVFQNEPYGTSNRVTDIYSIATTDYPMPTAENPLTVEAGQYFTWATYNSSTLENQIWTIYKITNGNAYLKDTIGLTAQMESEVDAKIGTITDDILLTGNMHIPAEEWALNAWTSYTETDSRSYRVRCKRDIVFPHDVTLLAGAGFDIAGYYSDEGGFSARTVQNLPAGKHVHLYVRRIVENFNETADVEVFANALIIKTKLSDLELYKPTYSDVTMFERMGIGGDSYASGGGIISGVTSLTWGKCLERQTSMNVDIYAHSGVDIVAWNQSSTYGLQALIAGAECGIYWLQHGINGTSTPENLGTPADMSANPHPATFYGQYVEAIEQIKTAFPDARIVIATIIGTSYGNNQTLYANVNEAIANIAEYCEVPMIDVTKDDFYRSTWYSEWNRSNHPTAMQNAGIAMANRRLISKCIQENPEYFVGYGSNW